MTYTQDNWIDYLAEKYKVDFRTVHGLFMSNNCQLIGLEALVKEHVGE